MNNIYNIVWSVVKQCWAVVSELCRRSVPKKTISVGASTGLALALAGGLLAPVNMAYAVIPVAAGITLQVQELDNDDYENNGVIIVGPFKDKTGSSVYSKIISGSGDLRIEGIDGGKSNYLQLNNANTYTGRTYIHGVNLHIEEAGRIAGDIILEPNLGGVHEGGNLEINDLSAPWVYDKQISGKGRISIVRSDVTFSGNNTFSGFFNISSGTTFTIGHDFAFGNENNKVDIVGSQIIVNKDITTLQNFAFTTKPSTITVNSGATWTITTNQTNFDLDPNTYLPKWALYMDQNSGIVKKGGGQLIIDVPFSKSPYYKNEIVNQAASMMGPIDILGGTLYVKGQNIIRGVKKDKISFDNGGLLRFGKSQNFTRDGHVKEHGGGIEVDANAEVEWKGQWTGTGQLVKEGAGLLHLSGASVYSGSVFINHGTMRFTGVTEITDDGGQLEINNNSIVNTTNTFTTKRNALIGLRGATLAIDADSTLTVEGKVKDGAAGTGNLTKTGLGTLLLAADNEYSGNTLIKEGTLAAARDLALGSTNNQTILDGGDLRLTENFSSDRRVILEKEGSVIVDEGKSVTMQGWQDNGANGQTTANAIHKAGKGTLVWSGDNQSNTAAVYIDAGTLQVATMNNLASAVGDVHIAKEATLSILQTSAQAADVNFTRQLNGAGTLAVELGSQNNEFTFASAPANNVFTGTLALNNGHLVLDDNVNSILQKASLQLNGGNGKQGIVTLLNSQHSVESLIFNGGRLQVVLSSNDHTPNGLITANNLNVAGGGYLAVALPTNLPNPLPSTGAPLFDQDNLPRTETNYKIIDATKVDGGRTQLGVLDFDGKELGNDSVVELQQGGQTAGKAYYNYYGSVQSDGVYLGYGLTKLEALQNQSLSLDNTGAHDNNLGVILTGQGGFDFNTSGTVTVGNGQSDYSGATRVINSPNGSPGNHIEFISDNAFGQTSLLELQSQTSVNLKGYSQQVGSLQAAAGSNIYLGGGVLTVRLGGNLDGELAGAGQLKMTGGTLDISQENANFVGTSDIDFAAVASIHHLQGLGRGLIQNDGELNLNAMQGKFENALQGQGKVRLSAATDITPGAGNQNFAGSFEVQADNTLRASSAAQLGSASINNQGTLVLTPAALWRLDNAVSGAGTLIKRGIETLQIESDKVSAGLVEIEEGNLLLGATPDSADGKSATAANLTGNTRIHQAAFMSGYGKLSGNLDNQGTLVLGSQLNTDPVGDLTVRGDYHGGADSKIILNTELGDDASPTDRLLISGNSSGRSTLELVNSRGLGAKTQNGIQVIQVAGRSEAVFALQGRAVAGVYEYFLQQGGVNTPNDGNWYLRSQSFLRPEAGSYIANLAAANNLFHMRLADREGRAQSSGVWLRRVGSHTHQIDTSGQLDTDSDGYMTQFGGEVRQWKTGNQGRLGLGFMLGKGQSESSTSAETDYKARGQVEGYSLGVYGTWYQNGQTLDGAYVDSWMQFSRLKASTNGEQLAGENYRFSGLSAALEAGWRRPFWRNLQSVAFITPQGQLSWSRVGASDFSDSNGTLVSSVGSGNIKTRVGVKLSLDDFSRPGQALDKPSTAYVEANWLHNSRQPSVLMDGKPVKQAGGRNIGELKVGVEVQFNKKLKMWGNVAWQQGDRSYRNHQFKLGFRYQF